MKYENLLKKLEDHSCYVTWHERVLNKQRKRFENPAVREAQRLSKAAWRERKASGEIRQYTKRIHGIHVTEPKTSNTPLALFSVDFS